MKLLMILCISIASAVAAPHTNKKDIGKPVTSTNPWDDFTFAVDLDVAGKYWLFWTPDDKTEIMTFEVHVQALGYVGFGLSPNGGMKGADVVMGWVLDDGTAIFHDRHAVGESVPIIDESQDVTLLAASQNDTHTILRFSRPYVTCDENDMDITIDTMRVIYSFSDHDPEDITDIDYHGPNRGTKSVVLINYNDGNQTLPEDSIHMDFLVSEIEVPRPRTTYWCEFMKIPQKAQKHHVIMGIDPEETPDDNLMKVYAVYQHAHLLGSKIKTRVYREGKEIEPLLTEGNYDFNFQETRMLQRERYIRPTDMLVVDCEYDTSDKKTITEGGLATINEMCVSFMYYYPRKNVTMCITGAAEHQTVRMIDDLELRYSPYYPYYEIVSPPEYAGMTTKEVLRTIDWTNSTMREKYQKLLFEKDVFMHQSCILGSTGIPPWWMRTPELGGDWVNPDDGQCNTGKFKQ